MQILPIRFHLSYRGGADLVLTDGYVFTVETDHTVAETVAIGDGQIVYVGENEGVPAFVGASTRQIDLQGRMLMPGLHDMHIHATGTVAFERVGSMAFPGQVHGRGKECTTGSPRRLRC
jgi:predicted amidohydrolase YtcJ